jgi:16S rRNA processing protein RimM
VHGLKGRLKIYSYAESAVYYEPGSKLILSDEAGNRKLVEVTECQPHKNVLRISCKGITGREQAEGYIGWTVLIQRTDLPVLEPDTYYWVDLLGMDVFTGEGDHLGQVLQIIPTGANDVYVVGRGAEAGTNEILIPALASVVVEIDLENRRMRVDLPEGLDELGQ